MENKLNYQTINDETIKRIIALYDEWISMVNKSNYSDIFSYIKENYNNNF